MKFIQHQVIKIYKKILLPIFFVVTLNSAALAVQSGRIESSSVLFDYSKLNFAQIQKEAEDYFVMYKKSSDKEEKEQYLNLSAGKYYILTKIDNSRIEPYIQLGRIYSEQNKPRLAKENFCKAINLNAQDPTLNYYFGDFYYNKKDYKKALYHYNVSYNNGFNNKYSLNLRLATIYEKFADLSNAKKFYDVSYSMKPTSKLREKIQALNAEDYEKSEYYRE